MAQIYIKKGDKYNRIHSGDLGMFERKGWAKSKPPGKDFDYKGFKVYQGAKTPSIVVDGTSYTYTGDLGGLKNEDLKKWTGNKGGSGDWKQKVDNAIKDIESRKKYEAGQTEMRLRNKIAPNANSISQELYGMNADDASITKMVNTNTTTAEAIKKILLENPREQTAFGKEFKKRKEAGETTDSILKAIQTDDTGKVSLRPQEVQAQATKTNMAQQYTNEAGQTIDISNYPNATDADLRNQGWTPVAQDTPQDDLVDVINTQTGMPLRIPRDQVSQMSEQWQVAGGDTEDNLFLDDPSMKKYFDTLSPENQAMFKELLNPLLDEVKKGNIVNPDIEITPEYTKQYIDSKTGELNEYYKGQMDLIKGDLETSFTRLQEDFDKGVRRAEDPFKLNLEAQAQAEAQAGTAYSSGRVEREGRAVQGQQDILDDAFTSAQRSIQDLGKNVERQVGSENLSNIPSISGYQASTSGFAPTNQRTLFTPQGGLLGDIPKQRNLDIENLKINAEDLARKKRTLDVSKI